MAESYLLQRSLFGTLKNVLPRKEEYVVWLKSSMEQFEAERKILKSERTEDAKASENRLIAFAIIARLRMIAFHPHFATRRTDAEIQHFLESNQDNDDDHGGDIDDHFDILDRGNAVTDILADSPMLRVCRDMLADLIAAGHKTIVFSHFRKPLKFLARVLKDSNIGFYEINGTVAQTNRDQSIKAFNLRASTHQVMLCTVGSGGLGLTLVGANRVILLGAGYNPMQDAQAVGRTYRIGQDRPVVVYRLLMAGLIDEKVSLAGQLSIQCAAV